MPEITPAPTSASDAPPGRLSALPRTDPALWALLLTCFVLLVGSWIRQEGYQLADSVEYLERAQGIAYGKALIDSTAIRSFGFSGLLVPLYWIYDALSLDEPVRIMQAAQLLQVLLTLALVFVSARLAARFVGRTGGLAAGALLAFNPIVLRWGVEPVSGIAAALFVTLAISRALPREPEAFSKHAAGGAALPLKTDDSVRLRDAWITGAWLGLAFLMAFQTMPVIGTVLIVIWVRELRRQPLFALCASVGLVAIVLLQCALDRWYYGAFGISVSTYFVENFGSNAALLLHKCGKLPLLGPYFYRAAEWLYNASFPTSENTHAVQEVVRGGAEIPTKLPQSWYFTNIARCLVLPAAVLVSVGVLRSLGFALRKTAMLWLVIGANVLALSVKGSKDFRLWLPFLPLIAVLGGIGFSALFARGRVLRLAGVAVLAATLILGTHEYRATNTRKFGGFWRAIALVNEHAAARLAAQPPPAATLPDAPESAAPKFRLSAAYHWSMFLRESRDVQLIKLPHGLDGWQSYDAAARAEDLDVIATLDAFITHLPVLTQNPDLFEVINRDFAVRGAFYDRVIYDSLGPIYVLEQRAQEDGGLRFFEHEQILTLAQVSARAGHAALLEFEREDASGLQHLALVDAKYTPLEGDGHGWITYTWHGGPLAAPEWRFYDRLTAPDYENSWQNNHRPAYGMRPTSMWDANTTLRESYLVVAEAEPFRPDTVYRRTGGSYRRGDLLPMTLWMDVVRFDEAAGLRTDRLPAIDATTRRPVVEIAPTLNFSTRSGATTFEDGMTRAAAMFLPVHPAARLADDARPVSLAEER